MRPTDIIMKKRMGKELTSEEIQAFISGSTDGSFADYQLAAMLMAICIRGLSDRETVDLTLAMAHSGETLNLSSIEGIKADKHSTGGVGDTTTLIVAPLLAACGLKIAKMSGRGLGFTGGTLDKLESIPGMSISMSPDSFMDQVRRIGIAIVGQTGDLAPADKILYALRDVTATVDCLPLVTSSILSKKIAAGCDVVVLDVKTGSGAIFPTLEQSLELARNMVHIGCMSGHKFSAMVTDMDQPLGMYVGNALEVEEAIRILSGNMGGALKEVSLRLGAQALLSAGMVDDQIQAMTLLEQRLADGEGLKKLAEMIDAQGGNSQIVSNLHLLPKAQSQIPVCADASGYICSLHTSNIGYAAGALGAGRIQKDDIPDPAVGLVMAKRLGDFVEKGEPYCILHANPRSDTKSAMQLMKTAITVSARPHNAPNLIHAVIQSEI